MSSSKNSFTPLPAFDTAHTAKATKDDRISGVLDDPRWLWEDKTSKVFDHFPSQPESGELIHVSNGKVVRDFNTRPKEIVWQSLPRHTRVPERVENFISRDIGRSLKPRPRETVQQSLPRYTSRPGTRVPREVDSSTSTLSSKLHREKEFYDRVGIPTPGAPGWLY